MAEDLMNTQTGGTGETIQLQPEVQTTPEQFDVKVNPPVDSEPPPPQVATVPTEEESKVEPIAPVDAVIEEPRQMTEGEPVEPPVQREGLTQVSLSDDADTQSAIQDLGIPTEAPINPNQIEESSELDLSGYTIDGDVQSKGFVVPEEDVEEVEETPTLNTVDLSGFTIDGVSQHVDTEKVKQKNNLKKEYANTNVEIDDQGKVKVKPKQPPKEKVDGELYSYSKRPGVMYKRKGPNDWYIDTKNTGNFVKITKNAKSRIAELERNATKVDGKVKEANSIIGKQFGNIKDFTEYDMLTSGGDPIVTKGLNFNQLTKSNEPTKTDMFTNSGQVNFKYDPNYAKANKESRALLDMQESKPDGIYRFPGSDALYEKKGSNWSKDSSGTGKSFKPLSKGDVKQRVAALEAKAIPTDQYTVAFNIAANIANTPVFKGEIKPADFSKVKEVAEKYTFDEAKNFADKDLISMFAKNETFSGKQLTDMLELQKQAKEIIGDGKYDPIKGKAVEGLMTDLNEYFDQSKAINEKINSAYSKDMSLDRYNFEEKRKDYNDLLNVSGSTNDMQDAAKETFEATLKMADFMQDAVDDGKMLYDRENGGFKFSKNITATEKAYYEKQLGQYLAEYKKVQGTRFESINNEITDLKGTMRDNLVKISSIKDKMAKLNSESPEYKDLSKELWSLTSENKKITRDVENKKSLKSTVFHTEPNKLVQGLKPTSSASVIFNAIPEGISPKQKFDLFYKQLVDKNNRLAKENDIDGTSLSGKLSQYGRELLDWGGYFSLSDAEKEWMDNRSMLNQLSPLYFNNDFGFTEGTGGFYNSFVNSFGQLLAPKASKAQGYINQSEAAKTIEKTLAEQGFGKDDIVDENYSKALKDKANVDFWSREQFGSMVGTTAGIIVPLVVTKKIPASALKVAGKLENLATKTKNAENIALYLTRAENVFDNTLKATKYGKYLVNPIKTGLEFEATGRIFGSTQDEMYFLSGLTGGIASEGFAAVASKLPTNKIYGYMKSMFGGQADKAVDVVKKIGELNVRGLTETAEEFGNELANIYSDELRNKGFFDEVKAQFGDLDRVQEFVISTYIMGAGFGIVDSDKKRAAYDSLSPEKKAQVDEVLNNVRQDMQSAENNVDKYVNEQTEEVERKQEFEKEPQKEVKTNDLGEIQFDVNNIEEASEGKPSVVAESKEEPSSFTEPIDLTKLEENAEKDQAGIPGEEQKGEEPKQTEPVAEAGEETPSPSGVVQEEQSKAIEEERKDILEDISRFEEQFQNESNSSETRKIAKDAFEARKKELEEFDSDPVEYARKKSDKYDIDYYKNLYSTLTKKEEVSSGEVVQEGQESTQVKPAAPATTTLFTEASEIGKIKNKEEKKAAETAYQEKHGVSHKKVSKIDTNFANIVKGLEKNNLIEKEC